MGGGGGRGSPGSSWRLSGKCVVGVESPKEADIKGESVILLTFDTVI